MGGEVKAALRPKALRQHEPVEQNGKIDAHWKRRLLNSVNSIRDFGEGRRINNDPEELLGMARDSKETDLSWMYEFSSKAMFLQVSRKDLEGAKATAEEFGLQRYYNLMVEWCKRIKMEKIANRGLAASAAVLVVGLFAPLPQEVKVGAAAASVLIALGSLAFRPIFHKNLKQHYTKEEISSFSGFFEETANPGTYLIVIFGTFAFIDLALKIGIGEVPFVALTAVVTAMRWIIAQTPKDVFEVVLPFDAMKRSGLMKESKEEEGEVEDEDLY